MENNEKYIWARKKVQKLKAFYLHLTVYILVNIMLFVINFVSGASHWWFIYPLFGWGIGLVVHGLSTVLPDRFGSSWEERKIKEYMDKDK